MFAANSYFDHMLLSSMLLLTFFKCVYFFFSLFQIKRTGEGADLLDSSVSDIKSIAFRTAINSIIIKGACFPASLFQ